MSTDIRKWMNLVEINQPYPWWMNLSKDKSLGEAWFTPEQISDIFFKEDSNKRNNWDVLTWDKPSLDNITQTDMFHRSLEDHRLSNLRLALNTFQDNVDLKFHPIWISDLKWFRNKCWMRIETGEDDPDEY